MKKFIPILMAVVLLFTMAIPCFAATGEELGIPNPSSAWAQTGDPYAFIVISDTDFSLYTISAEPILSRTGNYITAYTGYSRFDLINGQWVFAYEGGSNAQLISDNLVWSSSDIYDPNDGLCVFYHDPNFFPKPLYLQSQEIATESLQNKTLPALGGTMSILTLCGVGLMACLVVLSLFGKRSLISR